MRCPEHGECQKLKYDSDWNATTRNPFRYNINGLPRVIPYGAPVTNKAVAHCMLAYWDIDKTYYIYSKCINLEDLIMVCNALVSTRAVGHVQIYEITRPETHRVLYVDLAYIVCFENVYPALTIAEQLSNFFIYFKQLVEARGYLFRRYYDDTDADLPVTSLTPWRPKIPKMAKCWHEILNLPDKNFQPDKK